MAEAKYQFGVDQDEIAAKLAAIVGGLGDGTIVTQFVTEVTVSSLEDFELKQLTILYARKRPSEKVVIDEQHD